MCTVLRKEAEDARFHLVCASLHQTSSKKRDSEGAAVVEHSLTGGDRAREHASDSVKHKKTKTPSMDSCHDAESSGGDGSSSSSISWARERRVGNDFRAPNFARDRDRNSDRTAAHSDAHSTPADSCDPVASTDLVRSAMQ